ncbi:hypothetical protein C0J52_14000 [Blattella germanica]|nr:hypothetical protein C0J52_14000 [Blattella germanica]
MFGIKDLVVFKLSVNSFCSSILKEHMNLPNPTPVPPLHKRPHHLQQQWSFERVLMEYSAAIAMFMMQSQRSWLKFGYARGRKARQCYKLLQDVCSESAVPYQPVVRWIRTLMKDDIGKAMLTIVYDWDGVIINHTVPQRQTVIAEYYCKKSVSNFNPFAAKVM